MPFLRLYSREVSLAEKRLLAEKLISITLGAFQLSPQDRSNITIQFVPRELVPGSPESPFTAQEPAAVLEISDHDLSVRKINALVAAATPMLRDSAAVPHPSRLARMLGLQADGVRQIGFQFHEISSPGEDAEGVAPAEMRRAA